MNHEIHPPSSRLWWTGETHEKELGRLVVIIGGGIWDKMRWEMMARNERAAWANAAEGRQNGFLERCFELQGATGGSCRVRCASIAGCDTSMLQGAKLLCCILRSWAVSRCNIWISYLAKFLELFSPNPAPMAKSAPIYRYVPLG